MPKQRTIGKSFLHNLPNNYLIMSNKYQLSVLPAEQLKLFEELSARSFINDFYLAGGTCLALQIGHRKSIDFDFFTPSDFKKQIITITKRFQL